MRSNDRFQIITFLLVVLLPQTNQQVEAGQPTVKNKPNVVLIYADDLGYNDLSCYGAKRIQTPHCDRLAREGMRFTDAHSPSAVCSPSRYGLLTGRYAWRTWMKNWVLLEHMPLLVETNRLTLPLLFREQKYATGCVGKWHLGWGTRIDPDFSKAVKPGPLEVGFDEFFGCAFSHNSSLKLQNFVRNRKIVGLKKGEKIDDPKVQKRVARKLDETAIKLSSEAVRFIKKHRNEPFFLYYPTTNIHFPITPNSRFHGKSQAGAYGDFTVEFDWAVGEVLKTLDELNLTQNTIVIVTSDNGGRPDVRKMGMSDHNPNSPWRGTKRQIYEGGHRIPMIVRWPGVVTPGSQSDETICHTDFLATFASYFHRPLDRNEGEDSFDISPVLLGRKYASPIRPATVHHSVSGMFAIRKGSWKLIEGETAGDFRRRNNAAQKARRLPEFDESTGRLKPFIYDIQDFDSENPTYRLYNLEKDPTEKNDLAAKEPEKVEELKQLLKRYRTSGNNKK